MLWFQKDKDRKRRRRKSSRAKRLGDSRRPDPSKRGSGSRTSAARRVRRSTAETTRDTPREDTRDRDERRKEKSRDRTVAKEQEEIFAAINFDGEPVEVDEIDRSFGRAITIALYVLLGLLAMTIAIYAIGQGVNAWRAAKVAPLQEAAAEGRLDTIRALIARGVPVDGTGPEGGTPLASAILAGQVEAARVLLESGAEPTSEAMQLAMRHDNWQILKALIEAGGNPDVRGQWDGRSLLELATEREDIETVRFLLEHGADPTGVTNRGPLAQPALHYAAQHGLREIVELLLEHGADPRASWMGMRPRNFAEDAGHEEIADILARAELGM